MIRFSGSPVRGVGLNSSWLAGTSQDQAKEAEPPGGASFLWKSMFSLRAIDRAPRNAVLSRRVRGVDRGGHGVGTVTKTSSGMMDARLSGKATEFTLLSGSSAIRKPPYLCYGGVRLKRAQQ